MIPLFTRERHRRHAVRASGRPKLAELARVLVHDAPKVSVSIESGGPTDLAHDRVASIRAVLESRGVPSTRFAVAADADLDVVVTP